MRKLMMVVLMAVGCAFAETAVKVDSVKVRKDTAKIVHPAVQDTVISNFKIKCDSLKLKVDSIIAVKKASIDSEKIGHKIAVDSLQKAFKAKRDSLVNTIKDVKLKAAVQARIDTVEARHYKLREKIEAKKELIRAKTAK